MGHTLHIPKLQSYLIVQDNEGQVQRGSYAPYDILDTSIILTASSQRVARINELELKHQSNVNQMELTGRDEEARLLKLRLLTLRDENASLKDRLVQRDALVKQLSKQSSDTQAELKTSKSKLKAQDTQIRKQSNALEDLKVSDRRRNPPDI
jgi:hypothetical protein